MFSNYWDIKEWGIYMVYRCHCEGEDSSFICLYFTLNIFWIIVLIHDRMSCFNLFYREKSPPFLIYSQAICKKWTNTKILFRLPGPWHKITCLCPVYDRLRPSVSHLTYRTFNITWISFSQSGTEFCYSILFLVSRQCFTFKA